MAINTNDLFDAVSIVTKGIIEKYQYDQTIEAKIVSTQRKNEGIYKVEYQSGKFDAYSTDSNTYYDNEIVYVTIPKGDFTKQKFIVGRKVNEETTETKFNFNFKMPFDNFVQLESLTYNTPFTQTKGYLANYPYYGYKGEVEEAYLREIALIQNEYNDDFNNQNNKINLLEEYYNKIITTLNAHHITSYTQSSELKDIIYINNISYLLALENAIKEQLENYNTYDYDNIQQNILNHFLINYKNKNIEEEQQITYLQYMFNEEDYQSLEFYTTNLYKLLLVGLERELANLYTIYNNEVNEKLNSFKNEIIDNEVYKHVAENYLWSWTNNKPNEIMIETKLGIAVDVKTLLGSTRANSGSYGLRIEVTGKTRPTEERRSELITETIFFKNSDMYGNTYAFYQPTVQQKIFDISNFLTITTINIFFWQDHNFWTQFGDKVKYETDTGLLPNNIIISGLNVALGLTTDECNSDKVFLYTYDDLQYGHDPLTYQEEYINYRKAINEIYSRNQNVEEEIQQLNESLKNQPGYDWLYTSRDLQFAWIHLTETGPVLINHYAMTSSTDTSAFAYWARTPENNGHNARIHWYHYEYGCIQDTGELYESQGGTNWKYIGTTPIEGQEDNFLHFSVVPDINKAKEQWKALVTFDNVPFATEPLVFTNIDTSVETDSTDMLNEIAFRLLRQEAIDTEGNYNIVEDNTLRDFFVYDENNRVLKNRENVKYSEVWYYIQVWIRNNDTGGYSPLTYDPKEGQITIDWQPPAMSSMIAEFAQVTDNELSNAVLAPILEGASDIYKERIRLITRKFRIKDYLNIGYLNNTISAIVTRKNKTYHPQIELHFGTAGSMGSKFTVEINQLSPAGSFLIANQRFELEANVREIGKTVAESANGLYRFTWECLSKPVTITKNLGEYEEYTQEWEVSNGRYFNENRISGYIRNNNPPIFKVTVRGAEDYPIAQTIGFRLVNNASTAETYMVSCPPKIEFQSDGSAPITELSSFLVTTIENNEEIYPTWNLDQWFKKDKLNNNDIQYLALKEENYVATISDAVNPNYLLYTPSDINNKLNYFSSEAINGWESHTYQEYQTAIQGEYLAAIKENNADEHEAYLIKQDRLDKLSAAAGTIIPGYKKYKIDPYIRNNIGWYWDDSMINYYTIISWQEGNSWFKQAIPFTRNVYSSSLLNSWDGNLLIDEQENAIMAQMISAGAKDSNNTFTGVLMGNWAEKGNSSLDIPGLYGLNKGTQVFGFKTDGTGFIGKSGNGRIIFDGNQSLISNANQTLYMNLDPIKYSYNENTKKFEVQSGTGYTPYFLYAETKKSDNDSLILSWYDKFLQDKSKNYFIVDPNNGVFTSGGIIADYGKIGNWTIGRNGLYQEYNNNGISRYMYLGYPSNGEDTIINILNEYDQKIIDAETEEEKLALINAREAKIEEFNSADVEKYAIYAGYEPSNTNNNNGLFTVNWRGYMTARSGKIGNENPWYISDYGLIQTIDGNDPEHLTTAKKYATIFIGDATVSSNIDDWNNKADFDKIKLLPNDSTGDFIGPTVLGYSDEINNPVSGNFAIYAGGTGYYYDYNEALDTYNRKWSNDLRINFGIRTDGTLYSTQGQIGGWIITPWHLYSNHIIAGEYYSDFYVNGQENQIAAPGIVLDGRKGLINLGNGRTVLYPDGHIDLKGHTASGSTEYGFIQFANFRVSGNSAISGNLATHNSSVNSSGNYKSSTSDYDIKADLPYDNKTVKLDITGWTNPTITTESITTGSKAFSGNSTFNILNNNVGIDLVTGTINSNSSVLFIPEATSNNSYLGIDGKRWNLWANDIDAGSAYIKALSIGNDALYIAGQKAATQPWVLDLYYDLANKIKQATVGTTGTGGLMSGINKGFTGANDINKALVDLLNNKQLLGRTLSESSTDGWPSLSDPQSGSVFLRFPYINFTATTLDNGGIGATGQGLQTNEYLASVTLNGTLIPVGKDIKADSGYSGSSISLSTIAYSTSIADALESLYTYDIPATTETIVDDNGLVKINFKNGKGLSMNYLSINFNQADTKFFKTNALHSFYIGSRTLQNGISGTKGSNYDYVERIAIDNAKNENLNYKTTNSTKNIQIGYSIGNFKDPATTLMYGYLNIDAESIYQAGWNAAWSKISFQSQSNGDIKITLPKYNAIDETTTQTASISGYSKGNIDMGISGTYEYSSDIEARASSSNIPANWSINNVWVGAAGNGSEHYQWNEGYGWHDAYSDHDFYYSDSGTVYGTAYAWGKIVNASKGSIIIN